MSGLLWPGDERAAGLLDDAAVLQAMIAVEDAWLAALVDAGVAPAEAAADLTGLVTAADLPALAAGAEAGGNPVIGLVALLRERAGRDGGSETGRWLHRGLTSQDVVDTALVLAARDALDAVLVSVRAQLGLLDAMATAHRDTPLVARTLTQHAIPTTYGVKVAGWAAGVLGAATVLTGVRAALPVQVGGAAGTLAAVTELAGDPAVATGLLLATAEKLDLVPARPWHTSRQPVTAIGDALLTLTDALGHLAADVLSLTRSEVAEVTETAPDGGGGSSTMPQKANPVLAVLVRRAALAAPALAQTLHLAAATAVDERSDGAWHVEWETLALLARRAVVAAAQAHDLLERLEVHPDRMAATLAGAAGVDAEQRSMASLVGREPAAGYTGIAGGLVDATLADVRAFLAAGSGA